MFRFALLLFVLLVSIDSSFGAESPPDYVTFPSKEVRFEPPKGFTYQAAEQGLSVFAEAESDPIGYIKISLSDVEEVPADAHGEKLASVLAEIAADKTHKDVTHADGHIGEFLVADIYSMIEEAPGLAEELAEGYEEPFRSILLKSLEKRRRPHLTRVITLDQKQLRIDVYGQFALQDSKRGVLELLKGNNSWIALPVDGEIQGAKVNDLWAPTDDELMSAIYAADARLLSRADEPTATAIVWAWKSYKDGIVLQMLQNATTAASASRFAQLDEKLKSHLRTKERLHAILASIDQPGNEQLKFAVHGEVVLNNAVAAMGKAASPALVAMGHGALLREFKIGVDTDVLCRVEAAANNIESPNRHGCRLFLAQNHPSANFTPFSVDELLAMIEPRYVDSRAVTHPDRCIAVELIAAHQSEADRIAAKLIDIAETGAYRDIETIEGEFFQRQIVRTLAQLRAHEAESVKLMAKGYRRTMFSPLVRGDYCESLILVAIRFPPAVDTLKELLLLTADEVKAPEAMRDHPSHRMHEAKQPLIEAVGTMGREGMVLKPALLELDRDAKRFAPFGAKELKQEVEKAIARIEGKTPNK